jgi:hypothetical protein
MVTCFPVALSCSVGHWRHRRGLTIALANAVDQLPFADEANGISQWRTAWWNSELFHNFVNTEMNNLLLNKLCEIVGK